MVAQTYARGHAGSSSWSIEATRTDSESCAHAAESRDKVPYAVCRWLDEPVIDSPWNALYIHSKRRRAERIARLDCVLEDIRLAFPRVSRSPENTERLPVARPDRSSSRIEHQQTPPRTEEQPRQGSSSLSESRVPAVQSAKVSAFEPSDQQSSAAAAVSAQLSLDVYREQLVSKLNAGALSRRPTDTAASDLGCANSRKLKEGQQDISHDPGHDNSKGKSPDLFLEPEKPVPPVLHGGHCQAEENCPSSESDEDRACAYGSSSVESLSRSDVSLRVCISASTDSLDTLPTPPFTPEVLVRDENDLQSHETAFYARLQAYLGYSCGRNTNDSNEIERANTSGQDYQNAARSRPTKQPCPERSSGSHGEDGQSDLSDGDEQRRNRKRRKISQHPKISGHRFACPFHKFDPVQYAACEQWSCQAIENVKRHVLGTKHSTSPHMSPDKERPIRSIPPSRNGAEARWHAIYQRLFDIAPNSGYTMPSPYHGEVVAITQEPDLREILVPPSGFQHHTAAFPEPPAANATPNRNPHAPAYADEAQRLTEQYDQRRMEVRLWREQARASLQAIRDRLQALDFEERQLQTDLEYNLSNLRTGLEDGLSLQALLRRAPLVVTTRTEFWSSSDVSLDIPVPFEASVQGLLEGDADGPSFEGGSALNEAQPSVTNDSGYGTMPSESGCACSGVDRTWCSSCCELFNFPEDL